MAWWMLQVPYGSWEHVIGGATPRWKRSPPALVARFETLVGGYFKGAGYPAAFVGSRRLRACTRTGWVLPLSQPAADEARARGRRQRFRPMPGRPDDGLVAAPQTLVERADGSTGLTRSCRRGRAGSVPIRATLLVWLVLIAVHHISAMR